MNEPILATINHATYGVLDLVLSTYQVEVNHKAVRIPYLWVGRQQDGEVMANLSVVMSDRTLHLSLPPNHTWVYPRLILTGLRDLLLATGVVKDTGIRHEQVRIPAELWEYALPPAQPINL